MASIDGMIDVLEIEIDCNTCQGSGYEECEIGMIQCHDCKGSGRDTVFTF